MAAFNSRVNVLETLPLLAVSVTASGVATDDTLAVNSALVAFAGTVTAPGTVTAALLLERLTLSPPLGAAVLNVTVQASVPAPAVEALLQESALNAATGACVPVVPIPLRLTTALLVGDASLAIVI
jgi:hypothetical protein